MKKRVIALVLLCCFLLTACGGTGTVVEEVIWNNETFNEDAYDVIVVGTEPKGLLLRFLLPAMG